MVDYISTRGEAPVLGFEDVLLTGLARDGGLYVPNAWPQVDAAWLRSLAGKPYADVAAATLAPFVDDTPESLLEMSRSVYGRFAHSAAAPLVQIGDGLWLMELFHGPTLAFKDYALQMLGAMFDRTLAKRGERLTIVGATSGDTGSAAIEACRDRDAVDIFMLHPKGRVSPVQRRQMTTVQAPNVYNIAIDGSFDDCQDLVKSMFNDLAFRDSLKLSAVNSINFARIAAQVAYYVSAAVTLGAPDRPVSFAVPTGNFGNVYAAYAARAMGVPVDRLVIGTNANDILDRYFRTGDMERRATVPTISPSMDIQISSNLERLLFDLYGRDGKALAADMVAFRRDGRLVSDANHLAPAREVFRTYACDDAKTSAEIARTLGETGQLIDPHTAIGVNAARAARQDGVLPAEVPVVALACAHPAKFPDAVERASGVRPQLPERLADLFDRPERVDDLPNDLGAVQSYIRSRAELARAA